MAPSDLLVDLRRVGARVGVTTILRNVDLSVASGESIGLFGANGAGKTTLLRILATLLAPSEGEGLVLGADIRSEERYSIRAKIGLIGHTPSLYPELTLEENLWFAARIAGTDRSRVESVLATVGLASARDRRADACSHGMQRRAEFAREIMLEPELLLLDEPHTALDPDAVELVGHVVADVAARGGGAVLVSHDRDRVAPMVSRSVELKRGTLG